MTFAELGLSARLLSRLTELGFNEPTPIQAEAIPEALVRRDIMGAAQTGTGKTAAFSLPLLDRLNDGKRPGKRQVKALVLTPTRELAAQVQENIQSLGKLLPVRSMAVFGGVKINPQIRRLQRGVDILVATPGRLLDLYSQGALHFDSLQMLVLDEADRMLDMGFIHDIRKIIALLPKERQTLLFSATFSRSVRQLAKQFMHEPVEIDVAPEVNTAETVEHRIHPVDKSRKRDLLKHLIVEQGWYQVLVFSRTKHGANKLVKVLDKANIQAAAIHGNRSQNQRIKALKAFKRGEVQVLVATDIAARGIDIDLLPQVVNFNLPNVPEDYVHRIGRTGRAGAKGQAISLVCAEEAEHLYKIEKLIGQSIERVVVEGFEPTEPLSAGAPKKSKKPNKPHHKRRRRRPRSRKPAQNRQAKS